MYENKPWCFSCLRQPALCTQRWEPFVGGDVLPEPVWIWVVWSFPEPLPVWEGWRIWSLNFTDLGDNIIPSFAERLPSLGPRLGWGMSYYNFLAFYDFSFPQLGTFHLPELTICIRSAQFRSRQEGHMSSFCCFWQFQVIFALFWAMSTVAYWASLITDPSINWPEASSSGGSLSLWQEVIWSRDSAVLSTCL